MHSYDSSHMQSLVRRPLPRRWALCWTGALLPITILLFCQFVLLSRRPHIHDATVAWEPVEGNASVPLVNRRESKLPLSTAKPSLDLSCSEPFQLPAGTSPSPFDASRLERNASHLTCSMGCGNATIPVNVPSFIVIGAQKAGTSALYHYFRQVPSVLAARKFEPHFFDHVLQFNLKNWSMYPQVFSQERLCEMRALYVERFFDAERLRNLSAALHPQSVPVVSYEKTPSYIRKPGIAFRVKMTVPEVRLLAILRNPVERSYSQYSMEFDRARGGRGKLAESFDDLVQQSVVNLRALRLAHAPTLAEYQEAGSDRHRLAFSMPNMTFSEFLNVIGTSRQSHVLRISQNTLYAGMYALHLSQWLEHFELGKSLMVVQFERLMANKTGVFGEICDFLGLPRVALREDLLEQDYRPIEKFAPDGQSGVASVDPLRNETRDYLREFFRPHNEELARMLGDNWRNVWD